MEGELASQVPGSFSQGRSATVRVARPSRPIFRQEAEEHGVLALAVLKIPLPQISLPLETELLEQAQGGFIARVHIRFEPVETEIFERMPQKQGDCLAHETLPPVRLPQSETDLGALMLPTDVAEGAGTEEPAVGNPGDTPLEQGALLEKGFDLGLEPECVGPVPEQGDRDEAPDPLIPEDLQQRVGIVQRQPSQNEAGPSESWKLVVHEAGLTINNAPLGGSQKTRAYVC